MTVTNLAIVALAAYALLGLVAARAYLLRLRVKALTREVRRLQLALHPKLAAEQKLVDQLKFMYALPAYEPHNPPTSEER